ncbi:hypothetical protein [Luteitalea sp.]|uniref:hypothetical protein n=1 Tax=Luteitalea sp. TaxID=2004800 RepID=UPI0025C0E061|nr:hypothetical protein [Luteitalea sp.]
MGELSVGSYVVHKNMPQLGVGKVFCIGDNYACVGFIDASGLKEVKRLGKTFVTPLSDAPDVTPFEGWKVETTSDCHPVGVKPPTPPEWTRDEAYKRFQRHYPGGFASEQYQTAERGWKVEQHALWKQLLPEGHLRALATTDPLAAGALVMQVVQTTESPLLAARGELPMMTWALTKGAPEPYLLALADLIDSPQPTAPLFEALASALEGLPTKTAATKLLTWPNLTVVPFLARPDAHLFVKPQATQEAARKLGVDLLYNARPSWQTYQRVLTFGRDLYDYLKPRGAKDMIDVQSFIWTIGNKSS